MHRYFPIFVDGHFGFRFDSASIGPDGDWTGHQWLTWIFYLKILLYFEKFAYPGLVYVNVGEWFERSTAHDQILVDPIDEHLFLSLHITLIIIKTHNKAQCFLRFGHLHNDIVQRILLFGLQQTIDVYFDALN